MGRIKNLKLLCGSGFILIILSILLNAVLIFKVPHTSGPD